MTKQPSKSERCLELREKGLTPTQIAERIGTTPGSVSAMINAAKARRSRFVERREIGKPPVDPDAEQLASDVVLEMARAG